MSTNDIINFSISFLFIMFTFKLMNNAINSESSSKYLLQTLSSDDLKMISEKYGDWATKLAIAVCPLNDIDCIEREAKRLFESRIRRM